MSGSNAKRYRAELFVRDGLGWRLATSRRFRNVESARRQVVRWMALRTLYVTRYTYHREAERADYGRVADMRRDHAGRILARAAYKTGCEWEGPEIVVVPSVGELGYTP